jgi:hypothetical protein
MNGRLEVKHLILDFNTWSCHEGCHVCFGRQHLAKAKDAQQGCSLGKES